MRQWTEWVRTVNATRHPRDAIDAARPNECHVAAHMRHMVQTLGNAMSTVNLRVSAINDSLRFDTHAGYDPCAGRIVAQMRAVLTPMAKATTQKVALTRTQLHAAIAAAQAGGTAIGQRDACMVILAFSALLRADEVVCMNRGDITFTRERVPGDAHDATIMHVHVDRQAKNDKRRLGHDRVVRMHGQQACAASMLRAYLRDTRGAPDEPLFKSARGKRLAPTTPGGRLRVWLTASGMQQVKRHSFHSLRAGGATHAAHAGVAVRHIKELGNWRSDAVNVYMRLDLRDRLRASDALSRAL